MAELKARFDRVHTITDFYDGPRGGVADYRGAPHLYASELDDRSDSRRLKRVLVVNEALAFRARSEFEPIEPAPAGYRGWVPLQVRWERVSATT